MHPYYYFRNGQGDIIGLFDGNGNIVARYSYDSWGNLLSIKDSNGNDRTNDNTFVGYKNPIRYRGYYYDSETKLYYLQSRYYNPEWGRFLNADSITTSDLLGKNLFSYCQNNPVSYMDGGGTCPFWDGVQGFFSDQWNSISSTVSTFVEDPIQTYVDFYTTPSNYLKLCPIVDLWVSTGETAVDGIQTLASGDVNAIAYRLGYNTGNAAEAVALTVASEATYKVVGKSPCSMNNGNICFIAGTLILTSDGLNEIQNIKAGDKVWSENPITGEQTLKQVVQTFNNLTTELIHVTANDEEIITTSEHPFYVSQKGWIGAMHLRVGDKLLLSTGEYAIVSLVQYESLKCPIPVYNFEVKDFHTYYVGEQSILVHNKCTVVKENGVKIESMYPADHGGPAHLHVSGQGPKTKIGPQGQPVKGYPQLSPQQIKVVKTNIIIIKRTIKDIQKWLRKNQ